MSKSSVPTRTTYTVEVRPLTLSPFKTVKVFSEKTQKYETYKLERGKWYDVFLRVGDQRFTFTSGPGIRRSLTKAEAERVKAQYKKLGFAVNITERKVVLYPHLWGDLDANPAALKAMDSVAKEIGHSIYIASGKRSRTEQEILYALYLAGKGNLAAKPGTSEHETGKALDAWVGGNTGLWNSKRGSDSARRHGFIKSVASESWHATYVG